MIFTNQFNRICVLGTNLLLVLSIFGAPLSAIQASAAATRVTEPTVIIIVEDSTKPTEPATEPKPEPTTEPATEPTTAPTEPETEPETQPVQAAVPSRGSKYSTIRPDYFKWWATEDDLIRGLVTIYGGSGHRSWDSVDFLLQELALMDEDKAERWRSIMEYWDYANNRMKLNKNVLPNGLNNTNQLCLVALGYMLLPDGNIQRELQGRLETLLKSAEKYPNAYILCTGGGTAAIPEATAMAQWLIEHGIDEKRIIQEGKSLTTAQNIRFSYRILTEEYPEITDLAIITSDYHVPWGAVLLNTMCELGDHPLKVVSNAAYPTTTRSNVIKRQMEGILALSGLS